MFVVVFFVMYCVILLLFGILKGIYFEYDEVVVKEFKIGLDYVFDYIDIVFLKGFNGFLENVEEVFIVDLSFVCEIK